MPDALHLLDPNQHQRAFNARVAVVFLIVVLLSLVLFARMAYLQILQHERFSTISEENRIQDRKSVV